MDLDAGEILGSGAPTLRKITAFVSRVRHFVAQPRATTLLHTMTTTFWRNE